MDTCINSSDFYRFLNLPISILEKRYRGKSLVLNNTVTRNFFELFSTLFIYLSGLENSNRKINLFCKFHKNKVIIFAIFF